MMDSRPELDAIAEALATQQITEDAAAQAVAALAIRDVLTEHFPVLYLERLWEIPDAARQ